MRRGTLRSHVHLLRRNLWPTDRVSREQAGYVIQVLPGELDLVTFRSLLARGREALERHDLSRAERLLAEGMSLWPAPGFLTCPTGAALLAEAQKLTDEYLLCREDLADVMLAQQRHREVLPQLFAQSGRSLTTNARGSSSWWPFTARGGGSRPPRPSGTSAVFGPKGTVWSRGLPCGVSSI